MVSSLFAGTGERTLGAALENLQLCCHSAPGLVATRRCLESPAHGRQVDGNPPTGPCPLGGFLPVGDVLAEDYALGRRFLDAGFVARTSLDAVENRNVGCTMARTLERHTRWSKMRRALSPLGFALEPMMTPIVDRVAGRRSRARARSTAGIARRHVRRPDGDGPDRCPRPSGPVAFLAVPPAGAGPLVREPFLLDARVPQPPDRVAGQCLHDDAGHAHRARGSRQREFSDHGIPRSPRLAA